MVTGEFLWDVSNHLVCSICYVMQCNESVALRYLLTGRVLLL